MTSMGKMGKAKLKQPHEPFDEKWTSKKPQKAKLVILLKRNAKTIGKYHVFTINKPLKQCKAVLNKKLNEESLETA